MRTSASEDMIQCSFSTPYSGKYDGGGCVKVRTSALSASSSASVLWSRWDTALSLLLSGTAHVLPLPASDSGGLDSSGLRSGNDRWGTRYPFRTIFPCWWDTGPVLNLAMSDSGVFNVAAPLGPKSSVSTDRGRAISDISAFFRRRRRSRSSRLKAASASTTHTTTTAIMIVLWLLLREDLVDPDVLVDPFVGKVDVGVPTTPVAEDDEFATTLKAGDTENGSPGALESKGSGYAANRCMPRTATFLIFGTVPLVVVPRRTTVTTAKSPNWGDPGLENCITRENVAGSVAPEVHWQSTEVPTATFVVGTESAIVGATTLNAGDNANGWELGSKGSAYAASRCIPRTATLVIFGTVPFVVVPRCTVVTAASCPKRLEALENCITRANAGGSVAPAVHWQSTEVDCTTSVVGTESEMPATRWLSDRNLQAIEVKSVPGLGCTYSAIPSNFMCRRTEGGRYACLRIPKWLEGKVTQR
ncbi:hypothetical protein C8F04DRAFT_1106152 [Mycena alexandri]|uniref:Uncharacterized protein n=1 Tax=Mycena alexandri TaxID=1745969 RepID=A0AAD6X1B3_9AGAR|nr:hypothetical protein C8F04DRAFT_1106152 [Mycena alexandri]